MNRCTEVRDDVCPLRVSGLARFRDTTDWNGSLRISESAANEDCVAPRPSMIFADNTCIIGVQLVTNAPPMTPRPTDRTSGSFCVRRWHKLCFQFKAINPLPFIKDGKAIGVEMYSRMQRYDQGPGVLRSLLLLHRWLQSLFYSSGLFCCIVGGWGVFVLLQPNTESA